MCFVFFLIHFIEQLENNTNTDSPSSLLAPTIAFATSLHDIESKVLRLFDDVARSLNGISRVEERIHLGNAQNRSSSDCLFNIENDEIVYVQKIERLKM